MSWRSTAQQSSSRSWQLVPILLSQPLKATAFCPCVFAFSGNVYQCSHSVCDLGWLLLPLAMMRSKFTGEVACIRDSCITLLYMVVGPCSILSLAREPMFLFLGCYAFCCCEHSSAGFVWTSLLSLYLEKRILGPMMPWLVSSIFQNASPLCICWFESSQRSHSTLDRLEFSPWWKGF